MYILTQNPNQQCNQLRSQDARASSTIYPAFLAIPVSAPLFWVKVSLGRNQSQPYMIQEQTSSQQIKGQFQNQRIQASIFSGRVETFPQCQLYIRTLDAWFLRKKFQNLLKKSAGKNKAQGNRQNITRNYYSDRGGRVLLLLQYTSEGRNYIEYCV